ncbi:MAG: aspartate aminotransferase family protein [Deltaproteobacteria bacterium]|jgi:ornithine--oxo-acid transaminase|nr:aspartate aminotransferase family protein [Deltaproteobacteria bacterium]
MVKDLKQLLEANCGRQHELFAKYLNPQLVRVLRTISFDNNYVRADGPILYDEKGNDYLDLLAGYGVFALGRSNPKILKALHEAIDLQYPNMVQMDAPLVAGLLAERLVSYMPEGVDTVFFTNSGTESNEGAIKFARKATGRKRILFWDHAFHGLTTGSLALNGGTEFRKGFGELLPGATMIPMGDIDALKMEIEKGDVAAFIFEPIQGKGVYIASSAFHKEAEALCKKHGIIIICDEVQTGLGRTGKMFAHQHWNLNPDIVTVAKALSGGFVPVGAICYRRSIYEKVFTGMEDCVVHSNTFGRNILAMAAGLATLDIIEEDGLVDNAAKTGQIIIDGIRSMQDRYEMLSCVRGLGLMIGIEFGAPKSLKLKMGWKMVHALNKGLFSQMITVPLMKEHRILTQVAGHNVDIVKLLPPLIINEMHAERFLNAFEKVVADCHKFPGNAWAVAKNLAAAAAKSKRMAKDEERDRIIQTHSNDTAGILDDVTTTPVGGGEGI